MTGRLFGRSTGAGEPCVVEVGDRGLVASAGGERLELPFTSARVSFGGTGSAMVVVEANVGGRETSLYVSRDVLLPALRSHGGGQVRRVLGELDAAAARGRSRSAVIAAVVLVVLAGLAFAGYVGVGYVIDWTLDKVPPRWEVGLGQSLLERMHPDTDRVVDPMVRAGIDPIVERLLSAVGATPYEFEFHVIRSAEVNAFALPGGQIAVYTGLIARCENPEQLAGVLAHEIEHVLRRHTLSKLASALKWRLVLSLVIGDLSSIQDVMLGHAANLFTLKNDRDAEREADARGLELLIAARVAPEGMARFFEILAEEHGAGLAALAFLSTHPGDDERVANIRSAIAARGEVAVEALGIDWEAVRAAVRKVAVEVVDESKN